MRRITNTSDDGEMIKKEKEVSNGKIESPTENAA